jgi:hypothetical protein
MVVQEDFYNGVIGVGVGIIGSLWTIICLDQVAPKAVSVAQALKNSKQGIDLLAFRIGTPMAALSPYVRKSGMAGYIAGFCVVLAGWGWFYFRRRRFWLANGPMLKELLERCAELKTAPDDVQENAKSLLKALKKY